MLYWFPSLYAPCGDVGKLDILRTSVRSAPLRIDAIVLSVLFFLV